MTACSNSFRCRDCDAPTRVIESRGDGDTTRRVRECSRGHRFVTREVFDHDVGAVGKFARRNEQGRFSARGK